MKRNLSWLFASLALLGCRADDPTHAPEISQPSPPVSTISATQDPLASSDLPATTSTAFPHDPAQATIHRLSNGMTVYISTDREQPRFSAWIAVRSGSRNDPAHSTGLAHYLEHMLFKGTSRLGTASIAAEIPHLREIERLYRQLDGVSDPQRRAAIFTQIDAATQRTAAVAIPNEFDHVYSAMGISGLNAFTGDDMTVYVANVPSNRIEQWARVEGHRFVDPIFRLFFIELEAVYEEKNRSLDSPRRRVWEELGRGLFPNHPYGSQGTLGTIEHLKTPAYDEMVAFFRRWYVPNNMAIILSGDIDAQTALPVLERNFGNWHPQPLASPQPGRVEPVIGRKFAEVVARGEQGVTVAWPTVPASHPDEAALTVMDLLVDNATTGLLNLELLLSQKIPRGGSSNSFMSEAGYWSMRGVAKDGQTLAEVESLLMGVVGLLRAGQFTQQSIDAVVLDQEISTKRAMESNGGRASRMMESFVNREPWEQASARLDALRRVQREDVLRVATRYLGGGRMVVHRKRGDYRPPKLDKPTITPITVDPSRHSQFYRAVLDMPAQQLEPKWVVEGKDYRRLETPGGKVLAATNRRNDLFNVTFVYDVGRRRRPLLCHAVRMANRSGAGELNAEAFRRKLYALGSSLSAHCDADQVRIGVEGVDRNLDASLELVRSWLEAPAYDEALVSGLLENTLTERRSAMDTPRALSAALRAYATQGDRSHFLSVASNKKLARTKGKTLAREFSRLGGLQPTTLFYGPRTSDEVIRKLSIGTAKRAVPRVDPVRYRRVREDVIFFLHQETAQSQIQILLARPPLPRSQRPVAEVFDAYLGGGMGGLIFQEMREARGLAYSAAAWYAAGMQREDDSGLIGRVGTQADKTSASLKVMLELLRAPAQTDRLRSAVAQVEEDYRAQRISPRAVAGVVEGWDERGEKEDPRPWQREAAQAVSKLMLDRLIDDTRRAPVIISIVGDRDRVGLDALAKIARIEEIKATELFAYGDFPQLPAKRPATGAVDRP
ncbi:MAG: insulinase family protein [Nannocystaceae bacterium]